MWAGVDVGGRRKGFDVALVDSERVIELKRFSGSDAVEEATEFISHATTIAIDSPAGWAPEGETCRPLERVYKVTSLFYTPSESVGLGRTDGYYDWIIHGLELWQAVRSKGLSAIECFPTASFTRWYGPRATASRAVWTKTALRAICDARLADWDKATNQDRRDALAAALTARQWSVASGSLQTDFDPLLVPRERSDPLTYASPTS